MSKPIMTKQMLIDAKACPNQVDLFERTFGDSVVVTVKRAEKVAALFQWEWASCLLDAAAQPEYSRVIAAAWAEYCRARAAAWAEYCRARAPAVAEYRRVIIAAWAEYKRVIAIAWATAFIDMHKRGESA
jgi:hypothetical protein